LYELWVAGRSVSSGQGDLLSSFAGLAGFPGDVQPDDVPARSASPWRRGHTYVVVAGLLVAAVICGAAQGSLWTQSTSLAAANFSVSLAFVLTGLLLRREPGQRGVAVALVLGGLLRSIDFADSAFTGGPWAAYDLVFGAADRVFGAYALLRYPAPRLSRQHRIFLAVLVGWMLAGRTLIVVTSTARWNGNSGQVWWPSLFPSHAVSNAANIVVHVGEGVLAAAFIMLLVQRLTRVRGPDRIVLPPIVFAGTLAAIAATASATALLVGGLSASPNGAYLIESVVDFSVPLAFLVAAIQRRLDLRSAQIRVDAETNARMRIQRALHDGVQQYLVGLKIQLAMLEHGTPNPETAAAVEKLQDRLQRAIDDLRSLAHGIYPEMLTEGGLRTAIEDVAIGLQLPARIDVPETRTLPVVEQAAYFVACEALTNVSKHAKASHVSVHVAMDGSGLEMAISDDGVGGADVNGYGLTSALDRVRDLHGTIDFRSERGQGTHIEVRIPCE
jgi:signal transduction histidine kinase